MWHSDGLDTRIKIISPSAALEYRRQGRTAMVTGYFDPLTVEHARRLREIRDEFEGLIVALQDPADPILPAEARAELVAALRTVDYVVLPFDCDWPAGTLREELAHRRQFDRLLEFIHRRHDVPAL